MQSVSNSWKENQNKNVVNESFVEVSLTICDPEAASDAQAIDNGSVYFSNTSQTTNRIDKNIKKYSTLEKDIWSLDGSLSTIPSSNYGDNGFIGSEICNENNIFVNHPIIDIEFSQVHTPIIPGLTIVWGSAFDEYATDFNIVAYNNGNIVTSETVVNNVSLTSVIYIDIENYDLIRIEIIKWCKPFRRSRISDIYIGIFKTYKKENLTNLKQEQEVSPLCLSLPINSLEFSIDNSQNEYDPFNYSGLSKYLIERQEIKARYGTKLDSGTVEYIPSGVFYLSQWDAPQNGLEATFKARNLIELLSDTYYKGLYYLNGISLYDLAEDVLLDANLPLNNDGTVKWLLDDSLKVIYTSAPLPLISYAECLQYVAQMARCVMMVDRQGILRIKPRSTTINTDYVLDNTNCYSRPELSFQKPLKAVSVNIYNYSTAASVSELYRSTVAITGTKRLIINYKSTATNVTATVTNGTLISATYYTNSCVIDLSASGDVVIVIQGKILTVSETTFMNTSNSTGEIVEVSNPLITSSSVATAIAVWIIAYMNNRKILSTDWRSDVRLDATDVIKISNDYTTENMIMNRVVFEFNGAFKGTGEGRVLEN